MFAQHQGALVETNRRRIHDLIGALIFQHPILMDAGFMGKGIGADNRFVGLDHNASIAAHHVTGPMNFGGDNVGLQVKDRLARIERHHRLFQARVAGPFADAIDGHFHLPGAGFDTGQRVGRC